MSGLFKKGHRSPKILHLHFKAPWGLHQVSDIPDVHGPSLFESLTGSSSFPDSKHMLAGKKGALAKVRTGNLFCWIKWQMSALWAYNKACPFMVLRGSRHVEMCLSSKISNALISSHLRAWGFSFWLLFFSKIRGLFFLKVELWCHNILICRIAVYPEVSPAVSITHLTSIKLLNSCSKLAYSTTNSHDYPALPQSWLHRPSGMAEQKAVWSHLG